jgi:hypothetical protein
MRLPEVEMTAQIVARNGNTVTRRTKVVDMTGTNAISNPNYEFGLIPGRLPSAPFVRIVVDESPRFVGRNTHLLTAARPRLPAPYRYPSKHIGK